MTFDDLLPFVLPHVSHCPDVTAIFQLRQAAIEFCDRALVWREYQDPIETIDGQTAYAYTPADGQRISKLLSLTFNGCDVGVVDPQTGKDNDRCGETCTYAYGTFGGFELRPAQAAGLPIITYCAVAPSLSATDIPDEFQRYAEMLGHGALWRLFGTAKRDYTDAAMAASYKGMWDAEVGTAASQAFRGFSRSNPRARASWF